MLSGLVIVFLLRSKHLLFSWLFYKDTNPTHESCPHDLITSQRPHLKVPTDWILGFIVKILSRYQLSDHCRCIFLKSTHLYTSHRPTLRYWKSFNKTKVQGENKKTCGLIHTTGKLRCFVSNATEKLTSQLCLQGIFTLVGRKLDEQFNHYNITNNTKAVI